MRISDWSSDVCSSDLDVPAFFLSAARPRRQVEVHHILTRAELRIECNRRIVAIIGLDEHRPSVCFCGDMLKIGDQRGRDAAAAVSIIEGTVVATEDPNSDMTGKIVLVLVEFRGRSPTKNK